MPVPASAAPDPLIDLVATGRVFWSGGKPTGSKRPARLKRPRGAVAASMAAAIIEDRR